MEPLMKVKRKVWKPSTASPSLVITLPRVEFLKENDKVELIITTNKKIIIEKVRK
jgi:hypothetical protein